MEKNRLKFEISLSLDGVFLPVNKLDLQDGEGKTSQGKQKQMFF